MLELNKIYCIDNIRGMAQLGANTVDLTVTSPPYDNLRKYKGYSWDFEHVARGLWWVTKPGGVVVWIVADATIKGSETGTSFKQALYFKQIGFNIHDTMIYHTDGTGAKGSNLSYWQSFEYMFVFSKGRPKSINRLRDKKNKKAGQICNPTPKNELVKSREMRENIVIAEYGIRENVWTIHPTHGNDRTDHPAPFPEALAHDHILSWSSEGDLVLDPFMGSGTTAKEAILLKRNFIGFDSSQEYCDIANERIANIT
jgi:DNA modification methylase